MFESSRGNPKNRHTPQSLKFFGESAADQAAEYLLDLARGQSRCGPHPRGVGSALSRESRQHALLIVRQDETLVLCSHHDPKRVIRVAECDPSQRVKTNDQLSNSLTCDPELFGNHAAGHRSIQQIEQTLTARSRLLCSSRSIWPGPKAAGRAARCRPPCPGPLPFGQSAVSPPARTPASGSRRLLARLWPARHRPVFGFSGITPSQICSRGNASEPAPAR